MPEQPKDEREWWDKALDVLRHEEAAFRMVLWAVAIAVVIAAVVLLTRAIV